MKLHILSDLHIEFTSNKYHPIGKTWPESDILILAGDIGVGKSARNFIEEQAKIRTVIYILGNHEFYNHDLYEIKDFWNKIEIENLHVLDNNYVDIGRYRFIGTTLWSDTFGTFMNMNDFRLISNGHFTQMVGTAIHKQNVNWLEKTIDESKEKECVVISHHLPSFDCIPEKFKDSEFNKGYASDLDHLLGKDNVKLWIHGHTHDSVDKEVNGTRVVCNPRGYNEYCRFENKNFDENLIVELH
jgi:Icc-related predicted phosphoesterase